MIAAPSALPLGRFGARQAVLGREEIAAEIERLSTLLARLDRERKAAVRAARPGLGHSRRRGDCTLTRQAVDELLERFGSGETMKAIADAMGLSRGAVSGRIHRLRRESAGWSAVEADRFRDLVADDIPLDEAARLMGVSAPSAAAAFATLRREIGKQAI
jgi:biotin operon repressor